MGRSLSTGLVLVRSFQVLASFVPGAMNGWLLYHLYANRLGPSDLMLVLEILVAAIFAHSLCCILITHTGRRSRGTVWMVASIGFDVVFCFADVTVISLLSSTGLPSNCAGLTKPIWSKGNKTGQPPPGYSTTRFSDEQNGGKGELDKFCNMERGFFFIAVLMILAYILTIIMSVCRICELSYTRNSEVQYLLEEREELLRLELKVQEQELRPPPRPPSPTTQNAPGTSHDEEEEATAMSASMARPTMPSSSPSSSIPSSSKFMDMNLASIPESSSSHRHAYAGISSALPRSSTLVDHLDLGLDSNEVHANMALISDGARYNGSNRIESNQLPPYSPGTQRIMNGHGNENNDTRLSEYVKGATRAQDMKDAGTFQ